MAGRNKRITQEQAMAWEREHGVPRGVIYTEVALPGMTIDFRASDPVGYPNRVEILLHPGDYDLVYSIEDDPDPECPNQVRLFFSASRESRDGEGEG